MRPSSSCRFVALAQVTYGHQRFRLARRQQAVEGARFTPVPPARRGVGRRAAEAWLARSEEVALNDLFANDLRLTEKAAEEARALDDLLTLDDFLTAESVALDVFLTLDDFFATEETTAVDNFLALEELLSHTRSRWIADAGQGAQAGRT